MKVYVPNDDPVIRHELEPLKSIMFTLGISQPGFLRGSRMAGTCWTSGPSSVMSHDLVVTTGFHPSLSPLAIMIVFPKPQNFLNRPENRKVKYRGLQAFQFPGTKSTKNVPKKNHSQNRRGSSKASKGLGPYYYHIWRNKNIHQPGINCWSPSRYHRF